MKKAREHQAGNTLLIIAIAIVVGLGGAIYMNESRKAAATQKAQREAELKAQQDRAEREREALRKAAEDAKAKDILATSLKSADDVMARWNDASALAGNTARMALSTPLAALQAVKRDAMTLTVPPCLSEGKVAMVKGMELTLEGYLEFLANTAKMGDILASAKFSEAKPYFDRYKAARSACPTP